MPWRVRPLGSPQTIDNLSMAQLVEGLDEERWETSDYALGPNDREWMPIDSHPQLAEIALEIEAGKVDKEPEDPEEQRIDMNPLIDVCLVLLVFFILATTMSVLEKVLDIPKQGPADENQAIKQVSREDVKKFMVIVEARREGSQTAYKVDDKPTNTEGLTRAVKEAVAAKRNPQNNPAVVVDAIGVDWGSVVAVVDAAAGANSKSVKFLKHTRGQPQPARPSGGG